ncbi:MAG TPA: response regulator [Actinophytocola sp.]|jgi:CheY-like chemotaxis protein|uniref:response regulator n=1 Tax=Actinophytocola sp. TaxID=1872138 RepID=UPI002F926AC5
MAETFTAIAALAWPVLVFAALIVFWKPLTRLLGSADVTVEIGGQKVSIKQLNNQQTELVADLQQEVARLSDRVAALSRGQSAGTQQGDARPALAEPAKVPQAVLWVDDKPENNAVLVDQLRRDGVRVDLATSTAEGMDLFGRRRYGIVVSDMVRVEGRETVPDAGVRLVKLVRAVDPTIPFVVYSGPRQAYARQARDEGATEVTASPMRLLQQCRSAGVLE